MTCHVSRARNAVRNRPFATTGVGYIVLVLIIWWWWPATDTVSSYYVAARKLVNNHRIVSADLRRPAALANSLGFYIAPAASIEGRYIKTARPILPGQPIFPIELIDKPDMQLPNKMAAIVFPLPAESRVIGLLEVDSPVLLLGQESQPTPIAIRATVHAILCDKDNSYLKNCYPILRVDAAQIQFVTKNLATLRLVLEPDP
jgi:hypothetical protein